MWKSDDAGHTWTAVFDGVGSASVGALAVAPSNPGRRLRRHGPGHEPLRHRGRRRRLSLRRRGPDLAAPRPRGEPPHRRDHGGPAQSRTSPGRGTRARRSARAASAACTARPTAARTGQRTLFVNEDTGAVDLAVDPADPRVVFASTWQVRYRPWLDYFTPDIGPGSGLYKSARRRRDLEAHPGRRLARRARSGASAWPRALARRARACGRSWMRVGRRPLPLGRRGRHLGARQRRSPNS